ncbi:MAG: DUF2125 domain-containing protein [Pseudomonadota bacterium]
MPFKQVQPRYNAGRRIKWLTISVFGVVVAASIAWFALARYLDGQVSTQLANLADNGVAIDCAERSVIGYPFRMGIDCASLSINDNETDAIATTGEFRAAALLYQPSQIVGAITSPATLVQDGNAVRADWSDLRFVTNIDRDRQTLTQVNIRSKDPSVQISANELFAAETVEFFARSAIDGNAGAKIASRITDVTTLFADFEAVEMPPIALEFDVEFAKPLPASLDDQQRTDFVRGLAGTVNRAAAVLSNDQGMIISGPFDFDDAGLLNANLELRIIDVDAITQLMASKVGVGAEFTALINALPRSGPNGDEVQIPIRVSDGQVLFAGFPIFDIPAAIPDVPN